MSPASLVNSTINPTPVGGTKSKTNETKQTINIGTWNIIICIHYDQSLTLSNKTESINRHAKRPAKFLHTSPKLCVTYIRSNLFFTCFCFLSPFVSKQCIFCLFFVFQIFRILSCRAFGKFDKSLSPTPHKYIFSLSLSLSLSSAYLRGE